MSIASAGGRAGALTYRSSLAGAVPARVFRFIFAQGLLK
jgi:hypothetical protein